MRITSFFISSLDECCYKYERSIGKLHYRSFAPNWVVDEFENTFPIHDNSLVLVVENLDPIMATSVSSETEIRIIDDDFLVTKIGDNIKNIAARIVKFFVDYFEIQWKFEKLDIVVLPSDEGFVSVSYGVIFLK